MTTYQRLLGALGLAALAVPLLTATAAAATHRGVHAGHDTTVISRNDDGTGTGWLVGARHTNAAEYVLG
ncbi:hypothetical protein ACIA8O_31455 [Kitasatospora sp. NPDC051853]|uniref:hypothetical protein n=1 Tax=Kitasatospora sp. NPDC051853 TaxID=3364058 RepID=UPI00379DF0C3